MEYSIDGGMIPASGGYIEARSWDGLWGTSASANLIGQYTTRFFTVPRSSRRQSLYLKYVDPSGKVSRYPTLIQINYPLVPSLPSAVLDSSDRLFPEVSLFLPADPTDVFGVEIRDTDATTVLYQYGDLTLAISPDDPALIWVWDNSASKIRTKTLYAYCWNVLGEYSTARQVDISMPAPAVSGLTFDETDQSLQWEATSGVTYYEVQVSPSAGFSPVTASGNFDGTSFGLTLKDILQPRYYRVRAADVLGVGEWASGSHTYTTVGPTGWNNTDNVISLPSPKTPYEDPECPAAFAIYHYSEAYQQAMQAYLEMLLRYAHVAARPIKTPIAVGNLVTAEKYAEAFEIECWNSSRTTKIDGPRAVSAVYDSTSATWKQKVLVSFAGLTTGTVYSFRARVTTQSEGPPSAWTAWVDETAGDATAPSSTYTPTWTAIANGALCSVAVSGAASDLDRYEWYWSVASGAPASGTPANAPNTLSGATVEQTFAGTAGQTIYAWIRAVDTSGNRQAWQSLNNKAVGTIDDVADGSSYARTTPDQRDGGGYAHDGLLSGGYVKPGRFADSNPGKVTGAAQITIGSTADESGAWINIATVDLQVPAGAASMDFQVTLTVLDPNTATCLPALTNNIGLAIYTGTAPSTPSFYRTGTGTITYTTPSGTKLSLYVKGRTVTYPQGGTGIQGICSQDLVTPLRSGTVA